jgi:cyclase
MSSKTRRRDFLRVLVSGSAGLTLAYPAWAQGRGPAPITATKLTDGYAVLTGNGGNVGVVISADGLAMIDGGNLGRAADLAQAITEVSPRMVRVLFNTHYHFDHIGSNETLGMNGTRIIAHANVKARLGTTFENPAMGRTMQALPPAGLPTETFTTGGRLAFGGAMLEYTHTPAAHTDGDAFVFLPAENLIQTGDLYWIGRYPVVDYSVGGSLARMAEVLDQIDRVGDAATRIVPGHGGPVVGKTELRQTREMWLTINRRLEDFGRQGRSVDDVIAAAPTREFDAAAGGANPAGFLRQAYGGVLARLNAR